MDSQSTSMVPFSSYVSAVESIAIDAMRCINGLASVSSVANLLDGQVGGKLRETVPLDVRRKIGAFFSSSRLRSTALATYYAGDLAGSSIADPAMGAGDLLIEAAHRLPVETGLTATLQSWGRILYGRDIEPDFVRLAKARLVLTAISRGAMPASGDHTRLGQVFPGIRVGDGLDFLETDRAFGHIVMNPPFAYRPAPSSADWSQGRTNTAAVFLAKAIEYAKPGTTITAILPDVIRTGSRYERLRSLVSDCLDVTGIEPYGQFDRWTDVDVFILKGVVVEHPHSRTTRPWWETKSGATVGDLFAVSVGTVVPHRDPESQPCRHYLRAKAIPLGGEFKVSGAEMRGFQKRTYSPPFVVVRRTSRPGDKSRGIGTLISGTGNALVENHLIVLEPKDGTIETCLQLVNLLESSLAKGWLDERIRCRHLTVAAIKEMPWFDL